MTDDERTFRIGLNEAVFRELNERLESLSDALAPHEQKLDLVCECGQADCSARIQLLRAAYEQMRSDPLLFAVLPGHELPSVEEVVERRPGYHVVRKCSGTAEEVAEITDPRSD